MTELKSIPNALSPGTVLHGNNARYSIVQVLGQGSFGITYLARDIVGDDEVEQLFCIKEFFMRDINGRNDTDVTSSNREGMFLYYRRKFEQESDHLSQLRHAGIVMVTDAFRANGTSYYVMQYIDGQSLDQYIVSRGRLATGQAVTLARQVGDALQFMHSRGMVHLDVKPANVMMTSDGRAVLVDFGLSKQYDSDGNPESSTTVGTGSPGYAPIEQATHREGQGVPVQMDVYALGATVFKMLTGHRPPEAADVLNMGFPRGELQQCGVGKAVVDVVQKAMEPQCSRRYKTVGALVDALEKAVVAKPRKASGTGSDEETRVDAQAQAKGKRHEDEENVSPHQMKETAEKAGNSIFVILFAYICMLALSCLPDFIVSSKGQTFTELFFNVTATHSDLFPLLVFGVIGLVGALIAIWYERRHHNRTFCSWGGRFVGWLVLSLGFNVVASIVCKGSGNFDMISFFAMMQLALAIVTTYLVQQWLGK